MYAFLAMCLLNLFLMALSRGRALGTVTASTALAVVGWIAWWWGRDNLEGSGAARWGPVALLVAAIVYAFLAGASTVLETVAVRGTYLLVMLAVVPGLWWSVAVSLEGGLGYTTLFDAAIVVGTVAPLVFMMGAIGKGPSRLAGYLVAVSSYLAVAHAVVAGLTHAFTNILPDVLQVRRPVPESEPGWLLILSWKTAISSVGFLGAFVLVLAISVSNVAKRFRAADYPLLQAQINASMDRQRQATDPFATLIEQIYRTTFKMARVIYLVANFTAQSAIELCRRGWQVVLRVWAAARSAIRFFVIPVIALSGVGLILLAVVREVTAYDDGGTSTTVGAAALWGGVVCASALVLGLCGISFGLAALAPRTQQFSFNGVGAAVLLGGGFWALVSLGSIASWPVWNALRSVGLNVDALSLGPALWTNNAIMLGTATVLVSAALIAGGIRTQKRVERPRFFITSLATSSILFCTSAIVLGWAPLVRWVGHASTRTVAASAARMVGHSVNGHSGAVKGAAFNSNGMILATASADRTAKLWDIADPDRPRLLATLVGHTKDVNGVAFSPNSRLLATASDDGAVKLWDVATPGDPRLISTYGQYRSGDSLAWIHTVAFSPNGRTLAVAVGDGTARLWDVSEPTRPSTQATLEGHEDYVIAVAFSPDGSKVATASGDKTSRLWDISSPTRPRLIATLTGHTRPVDGATFSPNGKILATGSADHTVRLWRVADVGPIQLVTTLSGVGLGYGLAFSPNNRTLVTDGDQNAILWDLTDLGHASVADRLSGHSDAVIGVAFSRDGHTLVTTSSDNTARLWKIS
jgi:hypothetical protein